jgi:hypothetical protein
MVMVFIAVWMVRFMRENGGRGQNMETGTKVGLMAAIMRGSTITVSKVVLEIISGQMGVSMRVSGG